MNSIRRLKGFVSLWWNDFTSSPSEHAQVFSRLEADLLGRLKILTILFSTIYGIFSFEGYAYVSRYTPGLSLWNNTWPRILVSSIPILALLKFPLGSPRLGVKAKTILWFAGFSLILHATSWIHVWPSVLRGEKDLLVYITAANTFVIIVLFATAALPARLLLISATIFTTIFALPLFIIARMTKDPVISTFVINDYFTDIITGSAVGSSFLYLMVRVAKLEMGRAAEAEQYLGRTLKIAIFDGKTELLKDRQKTGLILSLDVRGYSQFLANEDPARAKLFLNRYYATVSELVGEYGGFLHKSMGDGHLISFGIMDEEPDLTDIPIPAHDLEVAENNRRASLVSNATTMLSNLGVNTDMLLDEVGVNAPLSIGSGLAWGEVNVAVVGSKDHRRELDIFGQPIIRATRLQEYTKLLLKDLPRRPSLVCVVGGELNPGSIRGVKAVELAPDVAIRDCPDTRVIGVLTVDSMGLESRGSSSGRAAA